MKVKFPGNRKNSIVVTGTAVIVLLVLFYTILRFSSRKSSLVLLSDFTISEMPANTHFIALNANATAASVKNPQKYPYAYFKFADSQRMHVAAVLAANGNAALTLKIHLNSDETGMKEIPFIFGFLYDDDFVSGLKLKKQIEKRPLITGDLRLLSPADSFSVSFDLPAGTGGRAAETPAGFFVYSRAPVILQEARIQKARIGWNRGTIPEFAFAPNGGAIDFSCRDFDFSGASLVFPSVNSKDALMPHIILQLVPADSFGTYDRQAGIEMNAGGEKIRLLRARGQRTVNLETAALTAPFSYFELTENAGMVTSVFMSQSDGNLKPEEAGRTLVPYKTDPGLIIKWPQKNWRTGDYELFEWEQFSGILFFDTRDYRVQQSFFRRLAFFSEKSGYRGRLLTDAELGTMHGYNAHDYSSVSLAGFFSKARTENFTLNEKELLLRDILVGNGVIKLLPDGTYAAGTGAVISISQESPAWLRSQFIAHEGWHGIYFTHDDYRNAVAAVYYTMDQTALEFLKTFWITQTGLQYDPADTNLMKNELMAYIMQQPMNRIASYFLHLADRGSVRKKEPVLAAYVRDTGAVAFEDAGAVLNDYAFDHWGFAAGRVSLVVRP